jgi:hypothetical protein
MAKRPNGGIVGKSIIPGTGQLFGVYSATTAAGLTSAGLYSTGNTATKILAVTDPVTTSLAYTDSTFANIEGVVATTANTTGNVRIFGTNFVAGSTVYVAGQASASTTVAGINEIRARIPSLRAGTYSLMIMSPENSGILSNLNITTVNTPTFVTTSPISYTELAGNTITISTAITAIGADRYRISAGSLPANVTFDTTTGALTGNITVASSAAWNFDVTATNDISQTTTTQNYYLVFNGTPVTVSYLVVGAGGGAGPTAAVPGVSQYGNGGAGGMITGNTVLDSTETYEVGVGSATTLQQNGTDSWINCPTRPGFGNIAAYGGGAGGNPPVPGPGLRGNPGSPGGSGGGGGYPNGLSGTGLGGVAPGHPEAIIRGNPGGAGYSGTPPLNAGAGGGAGSAGIGPAKQAGVGVFHGITGTDVYYARGGGETNLNVPGVTDLDVGSGPVRTSMRAFNTGYGATSDVHAASRGGFVGLGATPGVVVVSYISQSQIATGGNVTTYTSGSDKYYVHKFTNNAVPTSTLTINAGGRSPIWANANLVFYANYYNAAVSSQLRAYNATSYAVAAGNTLPVGLSVSTSGLLSGTATSESASFYINATSSASVVSSQEFSFAYTYPVPTWVTAAVLPGGDTTVAYSQQLSATVNNLGSVVYSVSAGNTLPSGLSLSSSGLLSGTPTITTPGVFTFYVRAQHNIGSAYYSERQFSINITLSYSAQYLVVAGGGAQGGYAIPSPLSSSGNAGGGGAGGLLTGFTNLTAGVTYTMTVGDGGTPRQVGTGGSGGLSRLSGPTVITATGGGGGGSATQFGGTPNGSVGSPGGSGGGGGGGPAITAGSGVPGQGNPGQAGVAVNVGGRGGGAGAPGATSGVGVANSITGSPVTYARGGGSPGWLAATNSGNGGYSPTVGAGGSPGVVILSVPTALYNAPGVTGTATAAPIGPGQTVITFTGPGTYTA